MHPSIILVLFALSATNALLPQLSSLAPRPVSQRVAASQLVAADPPPWSARGHVCGMFAEVRMGKMPLKLVPWVRNRA